MPFLRTAYEKSPQSIKNILRDIKKISQRKKVYNENRYLKDKTAVIPFGAPENNNDLTDFFLKHTDKDIDKWYHYFPIYDKHFSRFRNKPVNILEIGVFKGGSLKMWKQYFGKDSKIFGMDIDPNCKQYENLKEGISVIIGDQSDQKFMSDLMAKLPKIDILIDDGGHTTHQQINTFLACYDKISENGVYLCEDLHTNYWTSFIDSKNTFMEFAKKHVDYLNAWFHSEHKKTDKTVPLFTGITDSVTFYNSIVVFEKTKVKEPLSQLR